VAGVERLKVDGHEEGEKERLGMTREVPKAVEVVVDEQ
jgi:hypothetical protein